MKGKYEKGSLIVEASIVFPVMFLVIFFMIFAGNAYLQTCRVEAIVNRWAHNGAAYCADPQLKDIEEGSIPSVDGLNVYPYRFIFTGASENVEGDIHSKIVNEVTHLDSGLFSDMKIRNEDLTVKVDYDSSFLYATFSVDANYKIKIPVRLLGAADNLYISASTHVELPVSDTPELMRNVDMLWDYMERIGFAEKFEDLNNSLNKLKEWFQS